MIFEEIVLHNFGVYKGRHAISLEVESSHPVVLVGAMNGSGKTTFLDSMQLALYGKAARCTGRERIGYHDYLANMINRGATATQGAGVEFALKTRANGKDSHIRINRTWAVTSGVVKENLEIFQDGEFDSVASERWQEFVEDIMPSQVADLFFFDGEKIEALADSTRSASLLRVGVHSLLGIDLVDGLIKSLKLVERKRRSSLGNEHDATALERLHADKDILDRKRTENTFKCAEYRTEIDQLAIKIDSANQEFRRVGGELFERHEFLKNQKTTLSKTRDDLIAKLHAVVSGPLPLLLIRHLITEADRVAGKQALVQGSVAFYEFASKRDQGLLKYLRMTQGKELVDLVQKYLAENPIVDTTTQEQVTFLNPDEISQQFKALHFDHVTNEAKEVVKELTRLDEALLQIDRNLVAIPSEMEIRPVKSFLNDLVKESAGVSLKLKILEEESVEIVRRSADLERQIEKEIQKTSEFAKVGAASQRVITHSVCSRERLDQFKGALLAKNIERLNGGITYCFKELLNKRTLVERVQIDPATFELSVMHPSGAIVPASRLSAGERQLLAVASLWALSFATGRHLPAVIDTPLSRLDSKHRTTIVKNYFPNASHQVILLSTDEEIVGKYHDLLKWKIGREYLIMHDETKGTSFFNENAYFGDLNALTENLA